MPLIPPPPPPHTHPFHARTPCQIWTSHISPVYDEARRRAASQAASSGGGSDLTPHTPSARDEGTREDAGAGDLLPARYPEFYEAYPEY